ncbi:MAG TPA: hypothetical protein VK034_24150 [Enhygromyxa sp.]|nr:hypothetical protein [Enhygromyxa sp.]
MPRPRQTPRSLAAVAVLMLALGGCSSAEFASSELDDVGDGYGGDGDGDPTGDPTGGETGEQTTTGDGDGDGDGDEGTEPEGSEDPGLEPAECDPDFAQAIVHDLLDAQAEAAATLVRESVLAGSGKVPNIPLSARPFLNRFTFSYPPFSPPADGPELRVVGELWKPPMANAESAPRYRLQYAVQGPALPLGLRKPVDLAIVVDLGQGMVGEPLALAEEALAAIEAALVPGDRVTLIGAADQPQVLVQGSVVVDFGAGLLTGLLADQGPAYAANIAAALELGYQTVAPSWEGQGQPRVLLISNGHFQVDGALLGLINDYAADGHHLVALGLGAPESFAEASLRQLAAEGRGALLYDRSADQLWRDMKERFAEHMLAAATELEIRLVLPPGLTIRNRDPLAAEPDDLDDRELAVLGPDDEIVFHHELEACAPLDTDAVVRVEVDWIDPASNEAKQIVWEHSLAQLGYGSMATRKGAATVAYARALRGYRDGTRPNEGFAAVLDAISLIAEALESQPEDPDLIEMSQVLGKLEG